MEFGNDIRKLQIITVLDSISYGLLYTFVAPYIIELGGDHVTVGWLTVANLLGELVSEDVAKMFTHVHGKKDSLFTILNTAMISHLMLIATNSYWVTILSRFVFSITNQSQNLCKELLLQRTHDQYEYQRQLKIFSLLGGVGYIIGPILSGYIFDYGFMYSGLLAALLTLINLVVVLKIPRLPYIDANEEHNYQSVIEKCAQRLKDNTFNFKQSDYTANWDLLTIKYLFSCSIVVFFTKFSTILKRYNANAIHIGYVTAYMNFLIFLTSYYFPTIKKKCKTHCKQNLMHIALLSLSVCMLIACLSPFFEIFLVFCIPIIIIKIFINDLWKAMAEERKNNSLTEINEAISITAGLVGPLMFGVVCNIIGDHAVTLFSVPPIALSCYIVKIFMSKPTKDNGKEL